MQRKLLLYALLFLAVTSQKCYVVESGGPPSDTMGTIAANRYNAEQQQQHQQQHHPHTASQHQGGTGGGSNSGVPAPATPTAATHALYHPSAAGSGHMEHRNSYNLLSEAMSQAVSNEFSKYIHTYANVNVGSE